MAKDISELAKILKKVTKAIGTTIAQEFTSEKALKSLGNSITRKVKKNMKDGIGRSADGKKEEPYKKLKKITKEYRKDVSAGNVKGKKMSSDTSPDRNTSNQILTGKYHRSIGSTVKKKKQLTVGPKSKYGKEIAKKQAELGNHTFTGVSDEILEKKTKKFSKRLKDNILKSIK